MVLPFATSAGWRQGYGKSETSAPRYPPPAGGGYQSCP